jgi:hypothetical protein
MMAVADFTETEIWAIETALKQRWPGQNIELQPTAADNQAAGAY